MKKLAIILPDISGRGGTERAVVNLSNMLKDDFSVEVISMYKSAFGNHSYYDLDKNIQVQFLELDNLGTLKNLRNSYYSLRNYLAKNKPDYIIGTWYGVNMLLPFFKDIKSKVIGCEHVSFDTTPKMIKFATKFIYPKLDAVVMLSKIAKTKMTSAKENVYVIPNSLPFSPTDILENNHKKILSVGRIVEGKGYERFVPLAKDLQKHHEDWTIDIFGDGNLRDDLEKLYETEQLDNIKINSAVKEIQNVYFNSTIYVSTSYSEAMPMTFLEAMSCGLPVVSYRNEGAETIISDSLDGYIVDTSHEFINRVKLLIEDKEKRQQMQRKAIEKSNEYSVPAIKNKWLNLLNSLE